VARILVVDDEADIVRLVERVLGARGHFVESGRDGVEALERVRADPPDVLIVDGYLPRLDGHEVCRQLKGDPATRSVPILLMSASYIGLPGDDDAPGADELLVKPFVREILLAQVERLLAARRGG